MTAMWCGLPALLLIVGWIVFEPVVIDSLLVGQLPESMSSLPSGELSLVINDIKLLATQETLSADVSPETKDAVGVSEFCSELEPLHSSGTGRL